MSDVFRVSIPNTVKKTIQNIKEIAGNHSDEEVYAMLKECSMDPNETAQKLLLQDTFHEVKKKRDKRKEEIANRVTYPQSKSDATDIKWRPGSQWRRVRAGRDAGARRNMGVGRENGIFQGRGKDTPFSSHTPLHTDHMAASAGKHATSSTYRSTGNMPNEPIKASDDQPGFSGDLSVEEITVAIKKSEISSVQENFFSSITGQETSSIIASPAGVFASSSDTVLGSSIDRHIPAVVGSIKHEVGIHPSAGEPNADTLISRHFGGPVRSFLKENGSSERNSVLNGQAHGNTLEDEGHQASDTFQSAPSTATASTCGSRPSSNYSNRSYHTSGPLKAGPAKEWKPKPIIVNPDPGSKVLGTSDIDRDKGEAGDAVSYLLSASESIVSDISSEALRLEDLHYSDTQHVIIPDHLQVPESERSGLTFGSFDSNFGLGTGLKSEPENIKSPEEPSESSRELDENVNQFPSSTRDESSVDLGTICSDDQQPEMSENHSSCSSDFPSKIPPASHFDQSKAETSFTSEGVQHSVIHTAPVYSNSWLVPQMLGSPFTTFEGAEIQTRDAARLPSFIVPQPFDPSTNYYTSIYRPAANGDGFYSPFLSPTATPKYNGNNAVLHAQTCQSPQETSNSLGLPSIVPTLATQATGVVQSSAASVQQPVPVFRQPTGVHISNYPPNYVPYGQYFSPFYIRPPAAIHHFLGNAAVFPRQPQTGSLCPPPTATAGTTPVKYPVAQYKPATNPCSIGQETYGMNTSGYNSAVSGGNSTGSENLPSQIMENNMFITGQQSEGSAVWISPPGRDISTLQAGSFYNVLPHGHSFTIAPSQAGHAGSFTGLYHPTQSVAIGSVHPLLQQSHAMSGASEAVGPPAVYQQPQRPSQINWVNNF